MTSPNLLTTTFPRSAPDALMQPVVSGDQFRQFQKQFHALKQQILDRSDYQSIRTKQGTKAFLKKSGFRKLALAFSISTDVISNTRRDLGKAFCYETTCRATAPNGRFATASAACTSSERDFAHPENDVRAISQTRATNRAISDLLGEGVSAEEMASYPSQKVTLTKRTAPQHVATPYPSQTTKSKEMGILPHQKSFLTWFVHRYVKDEAGKKAALQRVESMTAQEAIKAIAESGRTGKNELQKQKKVSVRTKRRNRLYFVSMSRDIVNPHEPSPHRWWGLGFPVSWGRNF